MKKIVLIALVLAVTLGCSSMVACGGNDDTTTDSTTTTSTTTTESTSAQTSETTTTSSTAASSSNLWDDMPVYSGASQIQKGNWAIPPAEQGEFSKLEWRYYETTASAEDVAAFYKAEMPGNGWSETMWMEAGGVAWGYFNKNGEKDGAMFWCSFDEMEGKTIFAVMRGAQ